MARSLSEFECDSAPIIPLCSPCTTLSVAILSPSLESKPCPSLTRLTWRRGFLTALACNGCRGQTFHTCFFEVVFRRTSGLGFLTILLPCTQNNTFICDVLTSMG